jgi:hypothetical protein
VGTARRRAIAHPTITGRLIAAAGLDHPQEIRPIRFSQRVASNEVASLAQLYPSLRPGELLDGTEDVRFKDAWAMARAESFSPVA